MPDLWLTVLLVGLLVVALAVVLVRRSACAKQARLGSQPLDVTQSSPRELLVTPPEPASAPSAPSPFQTPVAPADQAQGLGWMKASDLAKRSGVAESDS